MCRSFSRSESYQIIKLKLFARFNDTSIPIYKNSWRGNLEHELKKKSIDLNIKNYIIFEL